jgi:excisionase family DNA binding protein
MRLKNISEEQFFTPEDISEKFKLSVATVYKLIAQDKIPYFKIGKSYRIPAGALDSFIMQEGNLARFMSSGPMVPTAAKQFVKEIEADKDVREKIIAAILFGSYARGNYDENSDIDLLVIVKENTEELQSRLSEISSIAMEATDFEEFLSPVRMSLAHWIELGEQKSPLYDEIQEEGIILWPKGLISPKDIENVQERS